MNWIKKSKLPLKIGLVFGGGGARGFGHIGVIKALEEEGIKADFVCGTSIGSLIAAAYASGATIDELMELASDIKQKDIRPNKILPTPSSAKGVEALCLKAIKGDKMFSELNIPFACVAVDINNGQEVVFESGFVAKCVSASCCLPGIFEPVEIDGHYYVDGGLLNTIPTDVAFKKHCDVIISVDINSTRGSGSKTTKLFDVLGATISIMGTTNANLSYKYADVVIKPNLERFSGMKFDSTYSSEMIEEGYAAAKEAIPEIKKIIKENKPKAYRMKQEIKQKKKELNKQIKEYWDYRANNY